MHIEKRYLWPKISISLNPEAVAEKDINIIAEACKPIINKICEEATRGINEEMIDSESMNISSDNYDNFVKTFYTYCINNKEGIIADTNYMIDSVYYNPEKSLKIHLFAMPASFVKYYEVVIILEAKTIEKTIYTKKEKIINKIVGFFK